MSAPSVGPWQYDATKGFVCDARGVEVAELFFRAHDPDGAERNANGRLIAYSPSILKFLHDVAEGHGDPGIVRNTARYWIERIEA